MIAAGIGLVLGLMMLFLGMALLEQERKDKKRIKKEREERLAKSDEESLASALVDNEQPVTFADVRRAKLGAFLVGQGVLMAIVGIVLFVVNAYLVAIPWYVAVPVVVLLLIVSLGTDAFMMGAPTPPDSIGDESIVPQQTDQEMQDCTENLTTQQTDQEE